MRIIGFKIKLNDYLGYTARDADPRGPCGMGHGKLCFKLSKKYGRGVNLSLSRFDNGLFVLLERSIRPACGGSEELASEQLLESFQSLEPVSSDICLANLCHVRNIGLFGGAVSRPEQKCEQREEQQ